MLVPIHSWFLRGFQRRLQTSLSHTVHTSEPEQIARSLATTDRMLRHRDGWRQRTTESTHYIRYSPKASRVVDCSGRVTCSARQYKNSRNHATTTGCEPVWRGRLLEHSPPVHVQAAAGTVVLFPASVYHRVHPHTMPAARVTVAFNVWLAEDSKEAGVDGVQRVLDGALLLYTRSRGATRE